MLSPHSDTEADDVTQMQCYVREDSFVWVSTSEPTAMFNQAGITAAKKDKPRDKTRGDGIKTTCHLFR